jgi:predicted RND superfamily exporter protein
MAAFQTAMTNFFAKRDRFGHGNALWVVLLLVFLATPAIWSLSRIDLENDIANWLPEDDPQARTLRWYQDNFQHEDRVLVSWDSSSLSDPRVKWFHDRLVGKTDTNGVRRSGSKLIKSVTTPQDLIVRMMKYDVEGAEAVGRLEGVLIGTGPLKVKLTELGRRDIKQVQRLIRQQAAADLKLDVEFLAAGVEWEPSEEDAQRLKKFIGADPPEDFESESESETDSDAEDGEDEDEEQFDPEQFLLPTHDFQVRYQGMRRDSKSTEGLIALISGMSAAGSPEDPLVAEDGCFFHAGAPVALSVSLTDAGMADAAETLVEIHRLAVEVGIGAAEFRMGGRPVAGSALDEMVKDSAWNSSEDIAPWQLHRRSIILLSGLVGIVLAFVMLRSGRLATLVLVVSYYTTLLAVSLVPLSGGHMNMVLVVMPTLMFVLTVSGSIHIANYWKHSAVKNPATAVVEAVRMARVPCTLASVTTAIGLLSLLTSTLRPVRQFGVYSAIGCLISLAMVLYGLPALLQFWPSRSPNQADLKRDGWTRLGLLVSRFWIPVTLTSIAVFVGGTWGLTYFKTETKAIRYFPDHSRVVEDYNFLEHNLSGIVPVELVIRFSREEQKRLNFVERMEVVREIERKVREHPEISGTVSLADFQEPYKPLPESASGLRKRLAKKKSSILERRVKGDDETEPESGARAFLHVADKAADLEIAGDEKLNRSGDELWRITAQVSVMSDYDYGHLTNDQRTGDLDNIVKSVIKRHSGCHYVVTGMVPVFLRTQQAVLDSLIWSFALAFGVIAVVMMILLRNPLSGVLTMLPNLMPVGIVFGLLSWAGQAVDIGTMITASVALGISVDGTLHLITWFRAGLRDGLQRHDAVARSLSQCGPAMWQTSLAVGLGLLMLAPAELLLISRFGWLMAALIGAALIANVVLLSALLAGPLGWLIQKGMAAEIAMGISKQPPAQPHLKLSSASTASGGTAAEA